MVIYLVVNKKSDSPLMYNYVDSQRLREAFFSPPKKSPIAKKNKKILSRPILFSLASFITLLVIIIALFFLNYDFLIIPRKERPAEGISVLRKNISAFALPDRDKKAIKAGSSSIYVSIPNIEKASVTLTLKKAINLKENLLFLYVKKTKSHLKIGLVFRDASFFSNSLNPLILELKETDAVRDLKIPVEFKDINLQNTNLSNINQISFSFYPLENKDTLAQRQAFNKNWILIKDLILLKKEDK